MILRLHIHLYCNFQNYLNLQGPPEASTGRRRLPRAFKDLQEPLGTYRVFQGPPGTSGALQGPSGTSRGPLVGLQGPSEAFRGLQELSGTSRDIKGNQVPSGGLQKNSRGLQKPSEPPTTSRNFQRPPGTSREIRCFEEFEGIYRILKGFILMRVRVKYLFLSLFVFIIRLLTTHFLSYKK